MKAQAFHSLDLDITTSCNLACSYCYRQAAWGAGRHMGANTYLRAVDWFVRQADAPRLRIAFMGGEPLTNVQGIAEVMTWARTLARERGIEMRFTAATNCTLIDDDVIDKLVPLRLELALSLDGTPEAHDTCRRFADGSGSSQRAFEGAAKYCAGGRRPMIRATVRPETADRLAVSLAYLRTISDSIHMEPDYSAEWTPEALAVFADRLRLAVDAYVIAFATGTYFYFGMIEKAVRAWISLRRAESPCGACRGLVAVGIDGGIYPCHRLTHCEEFRAGDVWEGVDEGAFAAIREHSALYDVAPEDGTDCAGCEAVITCRGGCPANNLATTGERARPGRAHCAIQRIIAREALRAFYLLSHDPETRPAFVKRFMAAARRKECAK